MALAALRDALAALDPTAWGLPLSAPMARATWAAALDGLPARLEPVEGTAPGTVGIVCSANVYVAPVEWVVQLRARGVRVWIKPARGQEAAMAAVAAATGAELRGWRGAGGDGGDAAAARAALAEADGVIAFGSAEGLDALRALAPPGRPLLGFGPRFGAAVVDRVDDGLVDDLALHDSRGCMSPAAAFVAAPDLDDAAARMAAAEARLPRGRLDPAEAAALRARLTLGRAAGEVREGDGWAVVALPGRFFRPVALPRLLVLHPHADAGAALRPYAAALGTLAAPAPLPGLAAGPSRRWATRLCAPGAMQRPPAERWHDGEDVLGALWGRPLGGPG